MINAPNVPPNRTASNGSAGTSSLLSQTFRGNPVCDRRPSVECQSEWAGKALDPLTCRSLDRALDTEQLALKPETNPEDWVELPEDEAYFRHLPHALRKACYDPFDYALGLTNGTIIFFSSAEFDPKSPEWITLCLDNVTGQNVQPDVFKRILSIPFDRGLEVRLSEIAWCADAPYGS